MPEEQIGPGGQHLHALEVHFGDCDPAGIVYFPRFFDFFHRAMESWFGARLGVDYRAVIVQRKLGFPAVHTEADFRSPCRFGEKLWVELRLAKLGRSSLHLHYRVLARDSDSATGSARLSGRTVCAVMDLDPESSSHMRAVELPADLRERMMAFGISASDD